MIATLGREIGNLKSCEHGVGVVCAEKVFSSSENFTKLAESFGLIAKSAEAQSYLMAGRQCVGMLGSQDLLARGTHFTEYRQGAGVVAGLAGVEGESVSGVEAARMDCSQGLLNPWIPSDPAAQVLCGSGRLPSFECGNGLLLKASLPQVFGLSCRCVAVELVLRVMLFHRTQFGDRIRHGGMGGGRFYVGLWVGQQVICEGGVEHTHMLLGGARGAANDQAAQLDQHVTDPSRFLRAAEEAAGRAKQRHR